MNNLEIKEESYAMQNGALGGRSACGGRGGELEGERNQEEENKRRVLDWDGREGTLRNSLQHLCG